MTESVATAAPDPWTSRFAGATRDVYRRTLQDLACRDPRIFCLDSDTGGLEDSFATACPGQYIGLGIAEANLMSVAAGLAQAGKIPFVNTMATFAAARACEQVKIDVAYNNLPVKIVATHAGLSAGHLGPTHHALEDVAIMRALPNMTVLVPADAVETEKAIVAAADLPGPVYVRLGRRPTELVYHEEYDFKIGRAVTLRPGTDVTLVASGAYPVHVALKAHASLAEVGISARVLNVHTIKPLDEATLVRAARETRGLVTVEDHSIVGGLGSAVAEAVAERARTRVKRIGIPDVFCDQVGGHAELLDRYGVTVPRIVEVALLLLDDERLTNCILSGGRHAVSERSSGRRDRRC